MTAGRAGTARPCLSGTPRPRLAGERSTSILGKPAGTKQESDELWLQDLVTCGTRRETQESVYAGIEVAIAAGSDVDRACQRGVETLLRVTGGPALAMVTASRMNNSTKKHKATVKYSAILRN